MDITQLKDSSFRLKGKNTVVLLNRTVTVSGEKPYVVDGPGEYEIQGVGVIGRTVESHTVYRVEIDGVSVVYVPQANKALSAEDIDALDGVDVLIIPGSDVAVSIIHEIEPSVVIPIALDRNFLKEMGKEDTAPQAKLVASAGKLPEQMQVVVLE